MCTGEYYDAIQISLNHIEKVDLVLKSIILTIQLCFVFLEVIRDDQYSYVLSS
jgi:hypothetical protein